MDPWRIGWNETRRQAGRVDPKVLAVLALLAVAAGGLWALAPPDLPEPEEGLWVVESSDDAVLRPAAASDSRFRVVQGDGGRFAAGDADLHLVGDQVRHHDSDRSRAALQALEGATRRWLDDRMELEAEQDAAFPISVTVVYEPRVVRVATDDTPPDPSDGSPPTNDPDGGNGTSDPPERPSVLDEVQPATIQQDVRPADVDPPFPIRSLLLTFAYVVPAGLLAQVQAANLHGERTRRRGILILSAPVSPGAILLGKSLPALVATVALAAITTLLLGAGLLGFLASLCFLGFLFSATTFLAVTSRNPRELGMGQVAATTLLNVFLFLPAMFPSIPPVAFLSPVHVVASGIRGDAVTWGQFLYATAPLALAAVGLAAVSVGLMREELLFSVRSTASRLLDALERITRTWWRVLVAGILVVPFVFAAEILVLVLGAVLGIGTALILWLPLSVVMEEAAKGAPIWARHRPVRRMPPWLLGSLVGAGFFLGEKSYLVLTLVGFESLPFGEEALALLGTGPGIALLMLPLALHVAAAIIIAYGSAAGKTGRRLGFLGAVLLHLVYDQILLRGAL